jgi:hypothetical protein
MNKFLFHIILILITLFSIFGWARSCQREKYETDLTLPADTVFVSKIDTVRFYDTIYKEKKVTRTVYVETNGDSVISLPVVQKHYSKDNSYDIWISGVEPLKMDSTIVYPKTETLIKYKENIVYREKERQRLEFYFSGGFYSQSNVFIPKIGFSVRIGEKWLISANIGLNKNIYDISLNYKIF